MHLSILIFLKKKNSKFIKVGLPLLKGNLTDKICDKFIWEYVIKVRGSRVH